MSENKVNQTFWIAFEEMLTLFLARLRLGDWLVIKDDRGRYVRFAGTHDAWIYGEFIGNNELPAGGAWDDDTLATAYRSQWYPSNETIPNPYLDLPPGSAAAAARMAVWVLSTLFEVANPRDLDWDAWDWTGHDRLGEQLVERFFEPLDRGELSDDWVDDFVPGRWWHRFETALAQQIDELGSSYESRTWFGADCGSPNLTLEGISDGQVRASVMCPTMPRDEQIVRLQALGWHRAGLCEWERDFDGSAAAASDAVTHIIGMFGDCFGIQHPLDLYDEEGAALYDLLHPIPDAGYGVAPEDAWEYGVDAATWTAATPDCDAEPGSSWVRSTGADDQPVADRPGYSAFQEHCTQEQLNELLHFGHIIPISSGETLRYVQGEYPGWTWNSLIRVFKAAGIVAGRGGSPPTCDDRVKAIHFDSATSFVVEWLDRPPTGRGQVSS